MMFNQIVNFPDELRAQVDALILTAYFGEKEQINAKQNR
jgi:hypothetical protein